MYIYIYIRDHHCSLSIIRFLPRKYWQNSSCFVQMALIPQRQCSSTAFPSSVCPEMLPQVLVGDCLGIVLGGVRDGGWKEILVDEEMNLG